MKRNDNVSNLIKRICTATALIALVLVVIYLAPFYIVKLVMLLLIAIAAYEWAGLSFESTSDPEHKFMRQIKRLLYIMTTLLCCVFSDFLPLIVLFGLSMLFWLIMAYVVMTYPHSARLMRRFQLLRGLVGILVLLPFYQAVLQIQSGHIYFFTPKGAHEVLTVFIFIWAIDTAAYFFGRSYGETPLAPQVSPGKTIAGVWGGILSAFIIVGFINIFFNHQHHSLRLWSSLVMALMLASAAVLGDLFESMMKRIRGVKDSGQLLPGHGGLLDRIDSAIAVFPIFSFMSLMFGNMA